MVRVVALDAHNIPCSVKIQSCNTCYRSKHTGPKTLTMPLTPPLLVTAAKLPPTARFIVPALLP
ncbi:hypothetical protein N7280_01480 [Rickettsia rhipicephali]|uniref:hypothetical protein n=1 Tax=Rickettsia rhipicephali TaxID=33992 RepID=UPI00225BF99E|nr:hypothetical protein [Rickettsia rhipicephali]MCX4079326.1 hypothetical protein [Rickettsia rhipicephali]